MKFLFFLLIFFWIINFSLAIKNEDIDTLLKIAKEQEDIFWKNPQKNYIPWNISVDYYTKLLQIYNNLQFQEKLIRLHVEGYIINSKNPNFFNFHYAYNPSYPIKVIVLNLKNYPRFDLPIFEKVLPLFITIQNHGEKTLDLSKMKFYLENTGNYREILLNNDQLYSNILKGSIDSLPINKIIKPKENFSFILLFSYNRPPKILKIDVENIQVNLIFFENILLSEPSIIKT
ncbi:MAG: hypothetical protein N2312_04975 [Dictyoglomaceae bacterium]|nr:hypothetical protein [Dictyoglomaceae bacterium]